jgi:hypothetical protein
VSELRHPGAVRPAAAQGESPPPSRVGRAVDWFASRGAASIGFFALAGALLAFVILYADYPYPNDRATRAFTKSGPYFLWVVLLCAQVALWFALLPTLAQTISSLREQWTRARRQAFGVAAVVFLLVVLPVFIGGNLHGAPVYPLPGRTVKLTLITMIGVCVALVGAVGIAFVSAAATDALDKFGAVAADELDCFFRLRAALLQLLAVEGAILGAAILATGALRHTVVALKGEHGFPKEILLAYGGYLSAVLALLYVPAYGRLLELGRRLRDRIAPLDGDDAALVESLEQREKLAGLLDLEVSASTSFRGVVLILTPLTTSLVGLLIGKT